MDKHMKWLYPLAIGLIVILVNVLITRHMQKNQLTLIIDTLNVPQIMTIDMDEVVNNLMTDGVAPADILAYVDNMNKAMHHRNVILLDKSAAVAIPDRYKLEHVTPAQLSAYLTANDITPSEGEAFKQNIERSEREIQSLFNQ